jgi:hypothetical protein
MRDLALILVVEPKLLISRRIEMMVGVDQRSLLLGEGGLSGQDRCRADRDCAGNELAAR